MTSAFQVTALPAANLDRFRRGIDDFGNACKVHIDRGDGVPLRCCPAGGEGCDGYQDHDAYPAGFGTASSCSAPTTPTASRSTTRSSKAPTRSG